MASLRAELIRLTIKVSVYVRGIRELKMAYVVKSGMSDWRDVYYMPGQNMKQ